MKKSRSNKSVKPQNRHPKNPNRKPHQPAARKAVARNTKFEASTTRKKSFDKSLSGLTPRPNNSSIPLTSKVGKATGTVKSKVADRRMSQLERGRAVKQFFEQGYPLGKLAETFRCSKSLIRELIILGGLPKDLEEAYLQKKINRKDVLIHARARKNHGRSAGHPVSDRSQNKPDQIPASVINEEERQKKIMEGAKLIVEWYPTAGLSLCDCKAFFEQVDSVLDGTRPWLFRKEAPQPHEVRPDEDPQEVIRRCRIMDGNPQLATDIVNNAVTWLARWVQRVIPDWEMMTEAITKSKEQLSSNARNASN